MNSLVTEHIPRLRLFTVHLNIWAQILIANKYGCKQKIDQISAFPCVGVVRGVVLESEGHWFDPTCMAAPPLGSSCGWSLPPVSKWMGEWEWLNDWSAKRLVVQVGLIRCYKSSDHSLFPWFQMHLVTKKIKKWKTDTKTNFFYLHIYSSVTNELILFSEISISTCHLFHSILSFQSSASPSLCVFCWFETFHSHFHICLFWLVLCSFSFFSLILATFFAFQLVLTLLCYLSFKKKSL